MDNDDCTRYEAKGSERKENIFARKREEDSQGGDCMISSGSPYALGVVHSVDDHQHVPANAARLTPVKLPDLVPCGAMLGIELLIALNNPLSSALIPLLVDR